MKGTDVLKQAQDEDRQHLQVLRNRELCARARARSGHARLVRLEDLDHLVEQGIATVLQFMCDAPFDSLVCQECSDGNLVGGREYLGEIARGRYRGGYNSNASFTCRNVSMLTAPSQREATSP